RRALRRLPPGPLCGNSRTEVVLHRPRHVSGRSHSRMRRALYRSDRARRGAGRERGGFRRELPPPAKRALRGAVDRPLDRRRKAAFEALEKAVATERIRAYGTATWNAYRAGLEARDAVSLADVLRAAEEVAGKSHHFRAVQLPFNLAMPEALAAKTQRLGPECMPFLHAARAQGLMVFSSASLLQGRFAADLPDWI